MASPIIAYKFPCSYLGVPQSIASALPSSLLGHLLPPTLQEDHYNQEDTYEAKQPGLSCPHRTIDGIASKTILESERSIADLRTKILATLNATTSAQQSKAPSLAVELWFTPIIAGRDSQAPNASGAITENPVDPLLPIVSVAVPLVNKKTNSPTKHPIQSRDPCEDRQFMIAQHGEFLELRYRDYYEYLDDDFFQDWDDDDYRSPDGDSIDYNQHYVHDSSHYACRVLRLTQWKLGQGQQVERKKTTETNGSANTAVNLHHLVVAWKESGSVLQVFGNGDLIIDLDILSSAGNRIANSNPDLLRFWDPNFRLQVFSDSHQWSNKIEEAAETTPARNIHAGVNTTSDKSDVNMNTDSDSVFPGTIHAVSLYIQDIEKKDVKTLWQRGKKLRDDPTKAFFEDPRNPFEPLRLIASPSTSVNSDPDLGCMVIQGRSALISVGGKNVSNSSTSFWDTMVEMVKIPTYGELVGPNNSTLRKGDRIPLEKDQARTELTYRHVEEGYFSVPTTSFHGEPLPNANLPGESFSYRLVAVRKGNDNPESDFKHVLLGRSKTVRQTLTILHRNHPPSLQRIPDDAILPEQQPSGSGARPWATLGKDIVLNDDADFDIDRIKVDLWTYNGTLTIDLEEHELRVMAEVTNCDNPTPTTLGGVDWICSGKKNRNITFLATPSDITRILSHVKYTALHWNQTDSILLRISDGRGGQCLRDEERQSLYFPPNTTIREDCFQTIAAINVPAIPLPPGSSSANFWRDHTAWWISLFVFFSVILCTCCCVACCFLKFRRDKKLNSVAVTQCDSPVILACPTSNNDFARIGITSEERKTIESMEEKMDGNDRRCTTGIHLP